MSSQVLTTNEVLGGIVHAANELVDVESSDRSKDVKSKTGISES